MNYEQLISQAWWQYEHFKQHDNLMQMVRYNMLATRLTIRRLKLGR